MNYDKLEVVREVLRRDLGCHSTTYVRRRSTEIWKRDEGDREWLGGLAWEPGEEIVTEEEIVMLLDALGLASRSAWFLRRIKDLGGTYLGPSPSPDA